MATGSAAATSGLRKSSTSSSSTSRREEEGVSMKLSAASPGIRTSVIA